MLKKRAADNNTQSGRAIIVGVHPALFCPSERADDVLSSLGAVTAIMTNPIWVVKVRMFTTTAGAPDAYRDGLTSIFRTEGVQGLFRGTTLALVGVSNGAIQFMVYERMKRWGFELKKRQFELSGKKWTTDADKLSNTAYSVMSGGSKIAALALTYPYQVVRSRIQVRPDSS
ncbi:unnamed protein product [Mycena citricolor]|uniref:Mitochondrial carrier protein n=1 Tax=Mycena citricolor TaxID=2018698 RepID=A0AAD2GSA3_9AGAR|nr:unnamed protein product [Mycena citricolor]